MLFTIRISLGMSTFAMRDIYFTTENEQKTLGGNATRDP